MKAIMLGTGNAAVSVCYNTCFVLSEDGQYFLVDGGGGNAIMKQLGCAGIDWKKIRTIFITHKHVDHILGVFWLMRTICQSMNRKEYEGEVTIYSHEEVHKILRKMAKMFLTKKECAFLKSRVHLQRVKDGEEYEILGRKTVFFDIHSTKVKQFGFSMKLTDEDKLSCCGDEPFHECNRQYIERSKWLFHEAFCLACEAEQFRPYEKHHSTVKDACMNGTILHVENLVLYHTEEKNLLERKRLYTEEGRKYFKGKLWIPNDLERIEL